MSRRTIVSNYFISSDQAAVGPQLFSPILSLEDATSNGVQTRLSASLTSSRTSIRPSATSMMQYKRARESSFCGQHHNNCIEENTVGFAGIASTARSGGVSMYSSDESRQSALQSTRNVLGSAVCCESADCHRRAKWSRTELVRSAGSDRCGDYETLGDALRHLKHLQEKNEKLNKVVEETREEVRRSREESDRLRYQVNQLVTELRLEVVRLSKEVEVLEGRSTCTEQSVKSLNGMQALVDYVQVELPTMRKQITESTASVTVLERLMEDVRNQHQAPPAAVSSAAGPVTKQPSSGTISFSSTVQSTGTLKPPAGAFTFGSTEVRTATSSNPFGAAPTVSATDASAPTPKTNVAFTFGNARPAPSGADSAAPAFGASKPAEGLSATTTTTRPDPPQAADTGAASSHTAKPANDVSDAPPSAFVAGKESRVEFSTPFGSNSSNVTDTVGGKSAAAGGANIQGSQPPAMAPPTNPFFGSGGASQPVPPSTNPFASLRDSAPAKGTTIAAPSVSNAFSFGNGAPNAFGSTPVLNTASTSTAAEPPANQSNPSGFSFTRTDPTAAAGSSVSQGGFKFQSPSSAAVLSSTNTSEATKGVLSAGGTNGALGAPSVFGASAKPAELSNPFATPSLNAGGNFGAHSAVAQLSAPPAGNGPPPVFADSAAGQQPSKGLNILGTRKKSRGH